jgi:hypothetical protein
MVLNQLKMYGRDSLWPQGPSSGAAYDPRRRAADADTDYRQRPMMMESAMPLPLS